MAKAFAMGSPCRKVSPMVSPKDSPSGVVGLMTDGNFRLAEHSTINIQKAESAVTGETIGETYGETFRHGLPMLIPFVQSTFGRLWGDGDIIFFILPNLYLLFLWHIKIIS